MLTQDNALQLDDRLRQAGLLSADQLTRIDAIQRQTGYSFIKTALTFGFLVRKHYYALLEADGLALADLRSEATDLAVCGRLDLHTLNRHLALPLREENGHVVVAMADPTDYAFLALVERTFGKPITILTALDLDITWLSHRLLGKAFADKAVFDLARRNPTQSAMLTFTKPQLLGLYTTCLLLLICFYLNFLQTAITINIFVNVGFFLAIALKLLLTLRGAMLEVEKPITDEELQALRNDELPIYSILLPVYKEDKIIGDLVHNLLSLDYPLERLDVKLLIEEDDAVTFNAVKNLDFPAVFEVIVVPFCMPKTKPKACNYGLHFVRGAFLTIYDAEDIPEPDQLKKVVAYFGKLPDEYACIQCALNYFNPTENVLTRMFTLEYSYWFDYILAGLGKVHIPIPLGGTSNHFKTERLLTLGAWDPFNVTEDADLGVRMYVQGYRVSVLNSTTYEEANNDPKNWVRQRSRWIKGYMQTYLVHMRNPLRLFRILGAKGFLGFNFFIGGTFFGFLAYPLLILFALLYFVFDLTQVRIFFPAWVLYVALFNLMVGNMLMIFVNMIAVFKRRYYGLILYALLNPLYWVMHSIAAYKGLWQLITKPFYWEKTNHGLSKHVVKRIPV